VGFPSTVYQIGGLRSLNEGNYVLNNMQNDIEVDALKLELFEYFWK